MKTLTLKPINHGWPNEHSREVGDFETFEFIPDHVPFLLRHEYLWLRKMNVERKVARWHVHRMIAMIDNPFGWVAQWREKEDEFSG